MTTRTRWREPASLLKLRWGSYGGRYLAGLTLILSSAVGLQGATPQTLHLLVLSSAAHATGWLILPARGSRRIWTAGPSLAAIWLLLPGPQALTLLVISYVCWLVVRQRPARSYVTVMFVLVTGVAIANVFREYTGMPMAMLIMASALVASAWLARYAATLRPALSNPRRGSNRIVPETVELTDS